MAERIYVVVLEKHSGIFGAEPVGKEARMVSRKGWVDEREAQVRAFNILKRDRPDENTMEWRVKDLVSEDADASREGHR